MTHNFSAETQKLRHTIEQAENEHAVERLMVQESRCFEYVNLLQCNKCLRFGHFARECTYLANCKKCAERHETAACTSTTTNAKCFNCNAANLKGASLNATHRA